MLVSGHKHGFIPYYNISGSEESHICGISKKMNSELARNSTFKYWRYYSQVWPTSLARAGFYHVPAEAMVKCYACNLQIPDTYWKSGRTPEEVHQEMSPNCGHVAGTSNIQMGSAIPLTFVDDPDPNENNNNNVDNANETIVHNQLEQDPVHEDDRENQRNVRVIPDDGPHAFPTMAQEEKRFQTFQNWPYKDTIDGKSLANAGFFYEGHADRVRCFHCRNVLHVRDWQKGHDPLSEHLPHCQFAQRLWKRQNEIKAAIELENDLARFLSRNNHMDLSQILTQYTQGNGTALLEVNHLDHIPQYRLSQVCFVSEYINVSEN